MFSQNTYVRSGPGLNGLDSGENQNKLKLGPVTPPRGKRSLNEQKEQLPERNFCTEKSDDLRSRISCSRALDQASTSLN